MKYYGQFYDYNVDLSELIPACGDTGVYILDGRTSLQTMIENMQNRAYALRHWRRYPAFRIIRADGFNRPIIRQSQLYTVRKIEEQ